ncbi:hypothetical protein [Sinorhizobium sp. 22678]|uniref:hypothetical protein n=1 Tax=Sinorhizobium sp. 22678 TaxID=3453955 RepID=UPI003F85530F
MLKYLLLFVSLNAQTAAFAAEAVDFSLVAEAMRRRPECATSVNCEASTGCLVPPPELVEPGQAAATAERSTPRRTNHETFHACREMVLRLRSAEAIVRDLVSRLWPSDRANGFATTLEAWNREVSWAPASATERPVTKFGDELRAVFGPLPEGNCLAEDSRRLGLEVGGNLVELRPNPSKSNALEFEHLDTFGRHVKWTDRIDRCDKPSLAGVTYCGMNSRLRRVVRGAVEWVFLCRKSSRNLELSTDPYWREGDPRFALYGAIGFNEMTGEVSFIDGRKDREVFDWRETFPPPGGASYSDVEGRARTEDLYDRSFRVDCFACHDNKEPHVIDPHVKQARVGYRHGWDDESSIAFGLGAFLPKRKGRAEAPFRVVGSSYTAARRGRMTEAKIVSMPGHPCTSCHVLTTQETGQRFAADAAGKKPTAILSPERALPLLGQRKFLAVVGEHRTAWATRSGAGKIHPWMLPHYGGDLSEQAPPITDAEWRALSQCLWSAGGEECGYRPLYTACPSPGRNGDGYSPQEFSTEIVSPVSPRDGFDRAIRLKWKYLNGYGKVPERDDVRFHIAVKKKSLSGTAPAHAEDYPTMAEARGDQFQAVTGEVGTSGSAILLKDASFIGHRKWTDPLPASMPRDYSIEIPASCGERYLFRILPKRFCFDYNGIAYGTEEHLIHADVVCAPRSAGMR